MSESENCNYVEAPEISRYNVEVDQGKIITIPNPAKDYCSFAEQIKKLYLKSNPMHRVRIGVYAGSFNPIHEGHLDIIEKALLVFDYVNVIVTDNPQKKYKVSIEDRKQLCIQAIINKFGYERDNKIGVYASSTIPTAKFAVRFQEENKDASVCLVRGLRNSIDFEYEKQLAYYNEKLNTAYPNYMNRNILETVYFQSSIGLSNLSSTAIRQVASVSTFEEFFRVFRSASIEDSWYKQVWEYYHDA